MRKKKTTSHALKATDLTTKVPTSWLPFRTTASLSAYKGMIGQDRAMRAVEIGLQVETRGFNIYALGETGSGKTSTLERVLTERALKEPVPSDVCYVYNFRSPDRPRPIMLPAGKGRALAHDMERVVRELERMIPRVLADGTFGPIRTAIVADTKKRADELIQRAQKAAGELDLLIEEEEKNLRVVPLIKGEPIDGEQFERLPKARRHRIESNILAFQEHLDAFSYGRRQLERDHFDRLIKAEVRAVTPLVEDLVGEVAERYKRFDGGVVTYLEDVKMHILDNHRAFLSNDDEGEGRGEAMGECDGLVFDPQLIYSVNVAIDRTDEKGAPVVVERVPTAANLCGYFEYRETQGGLITDHTMIRPGALQQANGGYLLLQVGDLLTHENAWSSLKRALRHKEVRVDEGGGGSESRLRIAGMLKPGSIPLKLKVILVGGMEAYYFLKMEDEEFGRLFKIKADFGSLMKRNKENVLNLAKFLGRVCREEGHLPLHRSGMGKVVEYASRLAGHKERMTTRRAALLDILAEANLFAKECHAKAIRAEDVECAITESRRRHAALGDAIHREINEGTIMIRTHGSAVGQINGIALYDVAGNSFGIPVRITARTYAGRRGVVNIDREVQLSGAIHDKGALILIGYLGGRYAQNIPLGLSASVTFEQSYDEIDGDSASGAELYALLSSLSECPIRQGIAVTGSVNQLGEVQPIGGVNEKIEGIFRVCKARGLTGEEGVMIPKVNLKNLMLSDEVIEAVKAGLFQIYAISTIDEGIEVLTGVHAGTQNKDGSWTEGSINARVMERLADIGEVVLRNYALSTTLDRQL